MTWWRHSASLLAYMYCAISPGCRTAAVSSWCIDAIGPIETLKKWSYSHQTWYDLLSMAGPNVHWSGGPEVKDRGQILFFAVCIGSAALLAWELHIDSTAIVLVVSCKKVLLTNLGLLMHLTYFYCSSRSCDFLELTHSHWQSVWTQVQKFINHFLPV